MRLWLAASLVCAILAVDSTAVSSLGVSPSEQRQKPNAVSAPHHAAPLLLLVTDQGQAVGGVALTAQ